MALPAHDLRPRAEVDIRRGVGDVDGHVDARQGDSRGRRWKRAGRSREEAGGPGEYRADEPNCECQERPSDHNDDKLDRTPRHADHPQSDRRPLDAEAFAAWPRVERRVLPALVRRTGNQDDAQDFLQEAAVRVLRRAPHIESFEQLVRVVNVTAHRLVSNDLRKQARLELRACCEPTDTVPDVADEFERRSTRATLTRRLSVALGDLNDRDREAILTALNRPNDDSGSALHESDAERHRAANRLYYARRRLRARMDDLLAGVGCWRLRHAWQRLCGSPMASAAASGCLALSALAAPLHLPASTATVVVRERGSQPPPRAGMNPESLAVAAEPSQAAARRHVDAPRSGGGPAPEAGSAPKPNADAATTTVQWHAPSGQGARAAVQNPPPDESAMLCYGNVPAVAAGCVAHPAKSPPTPPHTAPLP